MVNHVLHLGEVSGVAERLSSALNAGHTWSSSNEFVLPQLTPGDPNSKRQANSPLKAWQVKRRARLHISEHQPDLVHVHWARLAPFIPKTKMPRIIHAHGSDVRHASGPFAKLVFRKMREFDLQIASTPDLLEFMPSTSEWLPNPVDTDFFRDEIGPADEPCLFIFARFLRVKGADVLLEATRQVRQHLPNLRIMGISGGEFDDQARSLRVDLVPFVNQAGIRNLLQQSSLVVGQQKLGILSLAELETLAMKRPLLTPVKHDLYGDSFTNLLTFSHSELPELIIDFFTGNEFLDTELSGLRQDVEDLHSYKSVANCLSSLYNKVQASGWEAV